MSKLTKALTAAAGNAGSDPLYAEDVFSTYLYEGGNGSGTNQAVNVVNDVNLNEEGGLIWLKRRDVGNEHALIDTERGNAQWLNSNSTAAATSVTSIDSFNTDGFTVSSAGYGESNNPSGIYASWTFRKAEKFFDVVTWTGDGSNTRRIPHNINGSLGFIVVKKTSASQDWVCAHSYDSFVNNFKLNTTGTTFGGGYIDTPNETSFGVNAYGNPTDLNTSGQTYVAYLFASDAGGFGDDGSESIIKCGSYVGNGTYTQFQNLGWEPQWILFKNASASDDWWIYDSMRGLVVGGPDNRLAPNLSSAEAVTGSSAMSISATGFTPNAYSTSGQTYIYIAIRRPMKTPESGTEVFTAVSGAATNPAYVANHTVDMTILKQTGGSNTSAQSRLQGSGKSMNMNATIAEYAFSGIAFDYQTGAHDSGVSSFFSWMFKRATGFMDVVAYTGDGVSGSSFPHNLGADVGAVIIKRRDGTGDWYFSHNYNFGGKMLKLNTTAAAYSSGIIANSTVLRLFGTSGSTLNNVAGQQYIAYLFGSVAGVSKVGSYTGNGTGQNIDCGFSNGARFVLLKDVDDDANWNVYDTERGISTGTSYKLTLNDTGANSGTADNIEPYSGGFRVKTNPTSNASGHTFIYLAIA